MDQTKIAEAYEKLVAAKKPVVVHFSPDSRPKLVVCTPVAAAGKKHRGIISDDEIVHEYRGNPDPDNFAADVMAVYRQIFARPESAAEKVRRKIRDFGEAFSTQQIAQTAGVSKKVAYNEIRQLLQDGSIQKHSVGARNVIHYRSNSL